MSRVRLDYGNRAEYRAEGFDVDTPTAGYYSTRLRSGAVLVGVRIWFGPPCDPDTGEELDRSPRWQAEVNGTYAELETVWPKCAHEPVDEAEYRRLIGLQDWAREYAPNSAVANPRQRIDPLSSPLLF